MKQAHVVVGILALALNGGAGLYGAWCWWRVIQSSWFWGLLRAGQVVIVIELVLGGIYEATGHKAPSLHILYGVLPVLVSLIAEQLRGAAAQSVLDQRGYESSEAVGAQPREEQRAVVLAIVRRELGLMAIAALVNVVLLWRAAATAHSGSAL